MAGGLFVCSLGRPGQADLASRLIGFWRAAPGGEEGRQHLALLAEPSLFIDSQISRREPRRFQRFLGEPCWVAGSPAPLMAATPNNHANPLPGLTSPQPRRPPCLESRRACSCSPRLTCGAALAGHSTWEVAGSRPGSHKEAPAEMGSLEPSPRGPGQSNPPPQRVAGKRTKGAPLGRPILKEATGQPRLLELFSSPPHPQIWITPSLVKQILASPSLSLSLAQEFRAAPPRRPAFFPPRRTRTRRGKQPGREKAADQQIAP